jgi:hypothetical protein
MSEQRFSYEALNRLRPGAKWKCDDNDYANLIWEDDSTIPTFEELLAETLIVIGEVEAKQYQRDRAAEYPLPRWHCEGRYRTGAGIH